MSKTKIEWADKVWNPLTGCIKIGVGCTNCYAERMAKRLRAIGRPEYQDAVDDKGHWTGKITLAPKRLNDPLKWRKPAYVFVNSMSDLFHQDVPSIFICRMVEIMQKADQHIYQILTKRYSRPATELNQQDASDHILIGFSISNQDDAEVALDHLRRVHILGWRTWVSYEPALGPVDWTGWEFLSQLICGGESGPRARMMHPDWARSARDFCQANHIPFFFKQWGEWVPLDHLPWATDTTTFATCPVEMDGAWMCRVGKGLAGHVLDGAEWTEIPLTLPSPEGRGERQ
jgi:protein gp37